MEKQKLLKSLKRRLGLIIAILAMLAVSQGAMAATPASDGTYRLYFQFSSGDNWWNNTGCYHYAWVWGTNMTSQWRKIYKVGTTSNASTGSTSDVFYLTIPKGTITNLKLIRGSSSTSPTEGSTTYGSPGKYNETGDCGTGDLATYNLVTAVWNGGTIITQSSRYVSVSPATFSASATNASSGSGTSSDPYIFTSLSAEVSASATVDDGNFKIKYKYNGGSYTDATTGTITLTESSSTAKTFTVSATPCLNGTTSSGYTGTASSKTIYYKTQLCTTPTASDFTYTSSATYDDTPKSANVAWRSGTGSGAITTYYNGSKTVPTIADTYPLTIDVVAAGNYCAATGISLGDFVIDRASRTISITNTATTFCQSETPTVTSSVSAGGTDGTITYTKTGGTATATVNSSTGVITCTAPGTVIVKASISAGTNYSSAESTTKTFTFDASPSVGDLSIGTGGKSICLGSSADITVKSYSGSLQWKQSTSAAGTYSNVTSGTGATSATYNTGNSTKTGNTYYKVEVSNGVCAPVLSNYTYISVKNVPTAAQYIMTNNEQTFGSVVAPTITPQAGAGTINTTTYTGTSGTSYGPSTTLPTAIGTYKVTVDVAKGTSYCATTGIELSNNFVIKSNCETPNPGVISGTTAICAGGSVSLTLSGYTTTNTSLLWYKNGVSTGVTTPTYSESNVSSNVTYTVKVSRTDVADCSKSTDNYAIPVTQIPSITTHTDNSRCGAGTVTLGATASAGDVKWYSASTGGTALKTGTSYTTPSISTTTTYYVDATQNGCTTASRTAVTATVKAVPSIGSITAPANACGAGDIKFTANSVTGSATVTWYENSTQLGTGNSYTFTAVPAGTSHSVTAKATLNGCTSSEKNASASRLAVPTLNIGLTSAAITDSHANSTYGWEAATFTATSSTDGATVTGGITQTTWETAGKDGIINGNTAKGHVGDAFTGSYTATGSNGCTTSDSKTVTVIKAEENCNK